MSNIENIAEARKKESARLEMMDHIQLEDELLTKIDDVIDEYIGLISVAQVLGVLTLEADYLKKSVREKLAELDD